MAEEHGLAKVEYEGDQVTVECLCGTRTQTYRVPATPSTDTAAATGEGETAARTELDSHIEAVS